MAKANDFEQEWDEDEENELIRGVYDQNYTPYILPTFIYLATVERIKKGVFSALKKYDMPEKWVREMDYNVHIFSGAKTFQQVLDLNELLFVDGMKQPFSVFEDYAKSNFDLYNRNWLRTEVNMAYNQSFNARKWDVFQSRKNLFPNLRYVTVGDERVRDDHAELDGIIKPLDDPFWDTYYPQNDWGCRCTVEAVGDEEDITDTTLLEYVPSELFQTNIGKTGYIFNENHPYFNIPSAFENLQKVNFNLPMPNEED